MRFVLTRGVGEGAARRAADARRGWVRPEPSPRRTSCAHTAHGGAETTLRAVLRRRTRRSVSRPDARPKGLAPPTFCSESVPPVSANGLRVAPVVLINSVVQLPTVVALCGPFRLFQVVRGGPVFGTGQAAGGGDSRYAVVLGVLSARGIVSSDRTGPPQPAPTVRVWAAGPGCSSGAACLLRPTGRM
jgi:hypothetical protein